MQNQNEYWREKTARHSIELPEEQKEMIAKAIIENLCSDKCLLKSEIDQNIKDGITYTEMLEDIYDEYGSPFNNIYLQKINSKENETVSAIFEIPEENMMSEGKVTINNITYEILVEEI